MDEPKRRPSPDTASEQGRPARKSTEVQPVREKQEQDVTLETYEPSPERPGGDQRDRAATPDGPLPDPERVAPD